MKTNLLLSILASFAFSATAFAQDGALPGGIFIGSGANSEVYRLPDSSVQKILLGGVETRNQMVDLVNDLSRQYPQLVSSVKAVGQNSMIQEYAQGYSIDELKSVSIDSFVKGVLAAGDLASQARREMGAVWGTGTLAYGESLTLENGARFRIDENPNNFRYNAKGEIIRWFDPIFIADKAYDLSVAKTKILPGDVASFLPIDTDSPRVYAPLPDDVSVNGLKSVRFFKFSSGAMGAADLALTINDYSNALNTAQNQSQRNAAHQGFVSQILVTAGAVATAGVVIALSAAFAPAAITGGLLVALTAAGSIGFGSHISATFNDDIVNLWDRLAHRGFQLPGINHPANEKLKAAHGEDLQRKILAAAKARADYNGTISAEDIERVAYYSDRSVRTIYNPKEVFPATAGYPNGFRRGDVVALQNKVFRIYVGISQDLSRPMPPTAHKGILQRIEANKQLAAKAAAMGATAGMSVNVFPAISSAASTRLNSLILAAAFASAPISAFGPAPPAPVFTIAPGFVINPYPPSPTFSSPIAGAGSFAGGAGSFYGYAGLGQIGTVTVGPLVNAADGSYLNPNTTVTPIYGDSYNPYVGDGTFGYDYGSAGP